MLLGGKEGWGTKKVRRTALEGTIERRPFRTVEFVHIGEWGKGEKPGSRGDSARRMLGAIRKKRFLF